MTQKEKIIDRIQKLLALSKSDNVNESAAAAAQAQKLMSEHAISQAIVDVDIAEPEEEIADDILHTDGKRSLATWRGSLAMALCDLNQCKTYVKSGDLHIIGKPSKANTVRYLFAYLTREIDRLCANEGALRGRPGRTWNNNFRLGAVDVIKERLMVAVIEARKEMKQDAYQNDATGNGVALARIDNALVKLAEERASVETWAKKNLHLHARSAGRSRGDRDGRNAGRRAGASINLDAGGPSLGSGSRGSLTR